MLYILTDEKAYRWNYKRLGKNLLSILGVVLWYITVCYLMNQHYFIKTGTYLIKIR